VGPTLENRSALLEDIRSLIDAPVDGNGAPFLADMERTLTDGYAHALALEAECLRLERQMSEAAARIAQDRRDDTVAELSAIVLRLRDADSDLGELRVALNSLRARASELRAA
jgi:uncharacterized protein involved in exopolysaccharide biosynthesis